MTRPDRGWTLTGGTATALALGVLAAATMGTSTQRALAAAPATAAGCAVPSAFSKNYTSEPGATATSWDTLTAPGGISKTINVSGIPAGNVVRDVDVRTLIESQASGDIDLTITHTVAGGGPTKTVRLVSKKGAERGHNDLWNGTLFDDQSSTPVQTTTLPEVPAADVSPQGKLAEFNGMNPNGTWTVKLVDDRTTEAPDPDPPIDPPPPPVVPNPVDNGTFKDWQLALQTSPNSALPPATAVDTHASTGGDIAIEDATKGPDGLAGTSDDVPGAVKFKTVAVPLAPGQRVSSIALDTILAKSDAPGSGTYRPSDLRIVLESPTGQQVLVSPGGSVVADFPGLTTWSDTALYPATVLASEPQATRQPVGSLSQFIGAEAGGTWRLSVQDRFNGDVLVLKNFNLKIATTRGCATDVATSATGDSAAVTGQTGTVTFTMTNLAPGGGAADNANFTIAPAAGLDIVSVNGAPYTAGSAIAVGPLNNSGAGASKTFTAVVRANAAGTYTLTGTSTISPQADTNGANNAAVASIVFNSTGVAPTPTPTPNPTPNPGTSGNPTVKKLTVGLSARRFSVLPNGRIRTNVRLSTPGLITLQLKKGKKVVKSARVRGKAGLNRVTFRVVGKPGAYTLVVKVTGNGQTVTRTGSVRVRARR